MLRSMTGFGRGEASGADVAVVVELRSVNNRYLDIQVRAPREYMAYEPELQNTLKEGFKRGRLEAHIRRQPTRSRTVVAGDSELFRSYMGAIEGLLAADNDPATRQGAVAWVLGQPGVLNVDTADLDVMSEGDVLRAALDAAMLGLKEMRETEGRALYLDLDKQLFEDD